VNVTVSHRIDNRLRLDDIGAPIAVLDNAACVLEATPSAAALITRSSSPRNYPHGCHPTSRTS